MIWRCIVLIIILLASTGCSYYGGKGSAEADVVEKKFNVTLSGARHEHITKENIQNQTGQAAVSIDLTLQDRIVFLVTNNEETSLNCSVILAQKNQNSTQSKQGIVGKLDPGKTKKVSLTFDMLPGDSSLEITPLCNP